MTKINPQQDFLVIIGGYWSASSPPFLCADVYGYSRLMGQDEEATLRTLYAYRKIIDRLIETHRAFSSTHFWLYRVRPRPGRTPEAAQIIAD